MSDTDISPAISLAQGALLGLAAGVLFAAGHAATRALLRRAHVSAEVWRQVLGIAEKVVMAVEQSHGPGSGADKKQRAEAMLLEILAAMGLRVPQPVVEAALESAVLLLKAILARLTAPAPEGGSALPAERKEASP